MDKRFLTYTILIFLFLILYQALFMKPQTKNKIVKTTSTQTDTTQVEVKKAATIEVKNPIVVKAPTFEAKFSRKGGLLVSYTLNKFHDAYGKPVELIPEGYGMFDFEAGDIKGINLNFTADKDTFVINGNENIVLKAKLNDSLSVTKTFKFDPNIYMIDYTLAISGYEGKVLYRFDSGLRGTEKNVSEDLKNFKFIYYKDKLHKISLGKLRKSEFRAIADDFTWFGIRTRFFTFDVIHNGKFHQVVAKAHKNRISFVALSKDGPHPLKIYFGPIDYFLLKNVGYDLASIYEFGPPIINIFSKIILYSFRFLHRYIPNYGWVIVIFSLLMKVVFWPFTRYSLKSMRKMQELQPRMKQLQKLYKNDPQRLNKEMMELYRQYKVNPFSGCLILILQLPIFWALYQVLRTTIDLRGAPFIFWIKDLSSPDPYYILPILMGLASLGQALTQPAQDKNARMMALFMPIFITVIFLKFPSGIVLYWFIYNIVSVIEQYMIKKSVAEGR